MYRLEVKSSSNNLSVISDFVAESMKRLGVSSPKDIFDVQLAVDEACTNVIKYAYSQEGEGMIAISCSLSSSGNDIIINITDWGRQFDPSTVPIPDTKSGLDKREIGGLGIYLIRKLMTNVSYSFRDGRNELTLTKRLYTR